MNAEHQHLTQNHMTYFYIFIRQYKTIRRKRKQRRKYFQPQLPKSISRFKSTVAYQRRLSIFKKAVFIDLSCLAAARNVASLAQIWITLRIYSYWGMTQAEI
jgi:hypothetical protein